MNFEDIYFGDGSDGNATISTPTTLTRDMYYNDLTVVAGGAIHPAGFRIFVNGTLDLTAAPAAAISFNGVNGNNASGSTGGATITSPVATLGLPSLQNGNAGPAGNTGNGTQPANFAPGFSFGGVQAGDNGKGGNGATSTGGAQKTATAATYQDGFPKFGWTMPLQGCPTTNISSVVAYPGSSGGGSAGQNGGGAGGAPLSPGPVYIFARTIDVTGAGSSVIQSMGATGGAGGNGQGANAGGGGGAGGGAGGFVLIVYETLTGSAANNLIDVSGGNGGDGGDGGGASAHGGDGGGSGASGRATIIDVTAGTITNSALNTTRNSGGAASGATHGTGATAAVAQVSL